MSFRYDNYGTADLLTVAGTTVAVNSSQSKFESAFIQTQQVKCFDIPTTKELWCKFDVYVSGSLNNCVWYATNRNSSGKDTGFYKPFGARAYIVDTDSNKSNIRNALYANTLHTVLLHMVSDSSNGLIKVWIDGTEVGSYSGTVNNGNNFDGFYLYGDTSNVLFSNVIISDEEIGLNENAAYYTNVESFFDTKRDLKKFIEINQGLSRNVKITEIKNYDLKREVFKSFIKKSDTICYIKNIVSLFSDTARDIKSINERVVLIYSDIVRKISNFVTTETDVDLNINKITDLLNDTERVITNQIWKLTINFDILLKIIHSDHKTLDTCRNLVKRQDINFDSLINVFKTTIVNCDTARAMPFWIIKKPKVKKVQGLYHIPTVLFDTLRIKNRAMASIFNDIERIATKKIELLLDIMRSTMFRYENYGTGAFINSAYNSMTKTYLNLPYSKSSTGSAFRVENGKFNFHIPSLKELWVKFDIYTVLEEWDAELGNFNDNSSWNLEIGNSALMEAGAKASVVINFTVYNPTDAKAQFSLSKPKRYNNGYDYNVLKSLANSEYGYIVNASTGRVTVLLHIISDIENGLIEFWAGNKQYYTDAFANENIVYKGYLLGGNFLDFVQITALSENALLSNIIISNEEIGMYERAKIVTPWALSILNDVTKNIVRKAEINGELTRSLTNKIEISVDTERDLRYWRYENPGTASLLKISGNTVTNLNSTKSRTGTAFWQTQRVATFPIPATKEIWAKFDLYYGGTQWRVYDRLNGNDTGFGLIDKTTTLVSYINGPLKLVPLPENTINKNQLKTYLLHMVSDAENGLVELWVDGVKYYTDEFANEGVIYKGNVENGADFENFYMQSQDANNLFSNVIISNKEIGINENVSV